MANPSKRHQLRTSRLFLEIFERRELLSGTHFLLDPLFTTSPSAPLQTNDWTGQVLKTVNAVLQAISDPIHHGTDAQAQSTATASPDPGTTSDGGTAVKADSSSSHDSKAGSTVVLGESAGKHHRLSVTATAVSGQPSKVNLVGAVTGGDTLSPTPITTVQDAAGQQSGTTSSSSGDGSVDQASSDANTLTPDASGPYQDGGESSMASATPITANAPISSVQPSAGVGGSVQTSARVAVADAAGREHASVRSGAADVRTATVHDIYFSNGPDAARGRGESVPSLNRTPADLPASFLSKLRSSESVPESAYPGLLSDGQGYLDKASYVSDWDSPATASSRRDSSLELLATDVVFGKVAQLQEANPGAGDQGGEDPAAESPVSPPARGAGLLASPLLFDLDSLSQEAQAFYAQIEQMSHDLAGLLGRTNLLSGLVALGLAASAIEVARRRKQRAAHGIVLQGCTGTTFTCFPGLGGTGTWEE